MDKVTREDLRSMEVGETKTFDLPDAQAIDSAGVTAYQMQNLERCKYSITKDYQNNKIKISKNPL